LFGAQPPARLRRFRHGRLLFPNGATPCPPGKSVLLRRGYARAACDGLCVVARYSGRCVVRGAVSGPSPTVPAWPPVVSKRCNTVSIYFAGCCLGAATLSRRLRRLQHGRLLPPSSATPCPVSESVLPRRGYASRRLRRFGSRALLCVVRGGAWFGAGRVSRRWGVWGVYDPPAAGGSLSVVARFGARGRKLMEPPEAVRGAAREAAVGGLGGL
jgi:hypothetical protein